MVVVGSSDGGGSSGGGGSDSSDGDSGSGGGGSGDGGVGEGVSESMKCQKLHHSILTWPVRSNRGFTLPNSLVNSW